MKCSYCQSDNLIQIAYDKSSKDITLWCNTCHNESIITAKSEEELRHDWEKQQQ